MLCLDPLTYHLLGGGVRDAVVKLLYLGCCVGGLRVYFNSVSITPYSLVVCLLWWIDHVLISTGLWCGLLFVQTMRMSALVSSVG